MCFKRFGYVERMAKKRLVQKGIGQMGMVIRGDIDLREGGEIKKRVS